MFARWSCIGVGTRVRVDILNVRGYAGADYIGCVGKIVDVRPYKSFTSYMVEFDNGKRFEYTNNDLSIVKEGE